ncbi:MAG: hypothetical protein M3229_03975, partial [Actinomycetota bacterium]|nr:hypothetical protein [Actinomycetota bacterium]
MRFPWATLRVSCLVASAAASGYFWRGALEDPARVQQLVAPHAQELEPRVVAPRARKRGVGGFERSAAPGAQTPTATRGEAEIGPSAKAGAATEPGRVAIRPKAAAKRKQQPSKKTAAPKGAPKDPAKQRALPTSSAAPEQVPPAEPTASAPQA